MNAIYSASQPVAPLRRHFVQITGTLRINGKEVSSTRAAQLLHMVASGGGRLARSTIEKVLYGGVLLAILVVVPAQGVPGIWR